MNQRPRAADATIFDFQLPEREGNVGHSQIFCELLRGEEHSIELKNIGTSADQRRDGPEEMKADGPV